MIGAHGLTAMKSNGQRLANLVMETGLCVPGTYFPHKMIHKITWRHPTHMPAWRRKAVPVPQHGCLKRGMTGHMIDHFLVPQALHMAGGIRDVRSVNGTEIDKMPEFKAMDHALVVMTVEAVSRSTRPNARPREKKPVMVLDREKLRDPQAIAMYNQVRRQHVYHKPPLAPNADSIFNGYRDQLVQDFQQQFTTPRRNCKAWMSTETLEAVRNKKKLLEQLRENLSKDAERAFKDQRRIAKAMVRGDKKKQLTSITENLNDPHLHPRMAEIYKSLDALSGRTGHQLKDQPVKGPDGEYVQGDLKARTNTFADHFRKQLNIETDTTADQIYEAQLPPEITNSIIHEGMPHSATTTGPLDTSVVLAFTEEEIVGAIQKLHLGKAADAAGVLPEMLKIGEWDVERDLTGLINDVVATGEVPLTWTEAMIIPLYKSKGDAAMPTNYRAIVITDIISKVFTRAIYNQLYEELDPKILESQAGFRRHRSLTDHVFTMQQLMEASKEFDQPLYAAFVDIEKAYDGIPRQALLATLRRYGASERVCQLITMLYKKTTAKVRVGCETSDSFNIESGVKQGCILSTLLFNIYMDFAIRQVLPKYDGKGVVWHSRTNQDPTVRTRAGSVHDRLPRGWKEIYLSELLYADDTSVIASNYLDLINMTTFLDAEFAIWGLKVSISKTEIAVINPPLGEVRIPFYLRGNHIKEIPRPDEKTRRKEKRTFKFLGTLLDFRSASSEPDMMRRMGLAQSIIKRLHQSIWRLRGLSLKAKMAFFNRLVLPVLLHGCATWNLNPLVQSRLEGFLGRSLRDILGLKWQDQVSYAEIRHRCGLCQQGPIAWHLRYHRLRWFGHVMRMDPDRWPVQVLCGRPLDSTRIPGRPQHRWIDAVYQDLNDLGLPVDDLTALKDLIHNRTQWRMSIKTPVACTYCEQSAQEQEPEPRVPCATPITEATWTGNLHWFTTTIQQEAGPITGVSRRSGRIRAMPAKLTKDHAS